MCRYQFSRCKCNWHLCPSITKLMLNRPFSNVFTHSAIRHNSVLRSTPLYLSVPALKDNWNFLYSSPSKISRNERKDSPDRTRLPLLVAQGSIPHRRYTLPFIFTAAYPALQTPEHEVMEAVIAILAGFQCFKPQLL